MAEGEGSNSLFGDMAHVEYMSRDKFKDMVRKREALVTDNAPGDDGWEIKETAAFLISAPKNDREDIIRKEQFEDFLELYPPIEDVQQKNVYYYTPEFMDKSGTGIGLYAEMKAFFENVGHKAHEVIVVFNGHGGQAGEEESTRKEWSTGMVFKEHRVLGHVKDVPMTERVPISRFVEDIAAIAGTSTQYPKYMDVVLAQCYVHEGLDKTLHLTEPRVTELSLKHSQREQTMTNVAPKDYKVTCFTRYGKTREERTHNVRVLQEDEKTKRWEHIELHLWAKDVARMKEEQARARDAEKIIAPGAPDPPGPFQTTGDGQPMVTD